MSTYLSSPSYSTSSRGGGQSTSTDTTAEAANSRLLESMKSLYEPDQQVKYLHLQADVESLLQHLQFIKQQRMTSTNS